VNHHPKSVVRQIRTLRSVGTGGGRPPPVTRWDGKRGVGQWPQAIAPILDSTDSELRDRTANFRFKPDCVVKLGFSRRTGPRVANFLARAGLPGISLGWAGGCHSWRGVPEEFGKSPQVLRRCSEQDLVPCTAQASKSKPVELEDAFHVRESHLHFLALVT
jgi:hypothetical protein